LRDKKPHEGKYGPGQNSEELTASKCLPGHPGWVSTGLVVISGLEGCPEYGPLFPPIATDLRGAAKGRDVPRHEIAAR
jgi:hypothetical protein